MDVLVIALVVLVAVGYIALMSWVLGKSQASRLTHDKQPTAA